MNKFVKTMIAVAIAGGAAFSAQAATVTSTVFKPAGSGGAQIVAGAAEWDWSSNGASVVLDAGPFGTPVNVGDSFTSLIQTNLVGWNALGGAQIPAGPGGYLVGLGVPFAGGGYEFTAVARFTETVVFAAGNSATFAVTGGTVSIFYDDAASGGAQHNLVAGTGFDDGIEIYRGLIVGGVGNFATAGGLGLGSTNLSVQTLFYDSTVLTGLGPALDLRLNAEGQAAYPPGSADTSNYHIGGSALYPNYVVGANDLRLRFDGSSRFSVPEPSSLALLGAVLVGAGAVARRARKTA